jgi:GNAT superfamily N-acetyltransferase
VRNDYRGAQPINGSDGLAAYQFNVWLTMTCRIIEEEDLPELFDLRGTTRENPYPREALRGIGITEESTAALLSTTSRGWLCESGGSKAGFAIGDGKTGEMCVVAVAPIFEGQGVGSRLLDAVEGWLFSLGWKELWLWTSSDPKKRAYSFYIRRDWLVSQNRGATVVMKKSAPSQSTDPTP